MRSLTTFAQLIYTNLVSRISKLPTQPNFRGAFLLNPRARDKRPIRVKRHTFQVLYVARQIQLLYYDVTLQNTSSLGKFYIIFGGERWGNLGLIEGKFKEGQNMAIALLKKQGKVSPTLT